MIVIVLLGICVLNGGGSINIVLIWLENSINGMGVGWVNCRDMMFSFMESFRNDGERVLFSLF